MFDTAPAAKCWDFQPCSCSVSPGGCRGWKQIKRRCQRFLPHPSPSVRVLARHQPLDPCLQLSPGYHGYIHVPALD